MLVYATGADLPSWLSDDGLPTDADRLLRSASLLVADAIRAARYDTTSGGLPTDPELVLALRDATCAQVATWDALGIDPLRGAAGVPVQESAKSIGGASIQYAVYAATAEAAATAATSLCDESLRILAGAGLIGSRVHVW